MNSKKEIIEEWNYFCTRIDWGKTFLDARAIRFMNEFPKDLMELEK